jgi:hypothetical protein
LMLPPVDQSLLFPSSHFLYICGHTFSTVCSTDLLLLSPSTLSLISPVVTYMQSSSVMLSKESSCPYVLYVYTVISLNLQIPILFEMLKIWFHWTIHHYINLNISSSFYYLIFLNLGFSFKILLNLIFRFTTVKVTFSGVFTVSWFDNVDFGLSKLYHMPLMCTF